MCIRDSYSASSIKTLDTLGGGLVVCASLDIAESLRSSAARLSNPLRSWIISKAWTNLLRNLLTSAPVLQIYSRINPIATLKQTGTRSTQPLRKLPAFWFSAYSSMQAQIGLKLLNHVRKGDQRRIYFANLVHSSSALRDVQPTTVDGAYNTFWQLPLRTNNALLAQRELASHRIDTATTSLSLISSLTAYPGNAHCPVATDIYSNYLFIPCYANIRVAYIRRILVVLSYSSYIFARSR